MPRVSLWGAPSIAAPLRETRGRGSNRKALGPQSTPTLSAIVLLQNRGGCLVECRLGSCSVCASTPVCGPSSDQINAMTPAGRCLIHWATGPAEMSGTGLALHRGSDLSTTRGAPHPRGTDAYVPTPAGGPGRAPVARRLQRAFGD